MMMMMKKKGKRRKEKYYSHDGALSLFLSLSEYSTVRQEGMKLLFFFSDWNLLMR